MKWQRKFSSSFIFISLIALDLLGQFCQISQYNKENEKDTRLNLTEPTSKTAVHAEKKPGTWKQMIDTSEGTWNNDSDESVHIQEELFCATFLLCCNIFGLSAINLEKPLLLLPWLVVHTFVFCASYITGIAIVFNEDDRFLYNEAAFYFMNGFWINLNWIIILKTFIIMKKEHKME